MSVISIVPSPIYPDEHVSSRASMSAEQGWVNQNGLRRRGFHGVERARSLTDAMDGCDDKVGNTRVVVMGERTYAANAPPADARTWDLVRFVLTSRRACSSDFLRSEALCSVMSDPVLLVFSGCKRACILQSFLLPTNVATGKAATENDTEKPNA